MAAMGRDTVSVREGGGPVLLRHLLGGVLRRHRFEQERTLREVSASANISLAYLSEVERGVKEPSSELLAAICTALAVPLSEVLQEAGAVSAADEARAAPAASVRAPDEARAAPAASVRAPDEARAAPAASVRAAA
ncbi:MAG: helix-turn-helix domain-containing protein [Mycobacteriales bacterium]